MNTTSENNATETSHLKSFFFSPFGRILSIGFVCILLIIPMVRIHFLVMERMERAHQVSFEIQDEWGGRFEIEDPVIRIPKMDAKTKKVSSFLFVYPQKSKQLVNSTVSMKKRGIFELPVFTGELKGNYQFKLPENKAELDITKCEIGYFVNAPEQISTLNDFEVDEKPHAFERVEKMNGTNFAHSISFDCTSKKQLNLVSKITFKGCDELVLKEKAIQNSIQLTSNWGDPIFHGHLPEPNSVKITKSSSNASWSATDINRQGDNSTFDNTSRSKKIATMQFKKAIDSYDLTDRTLKYAFLVILLTFIVFFISEILLKSVIHPLHYFMIGLSLCIYYVIVLSVSEHFSFFTAYIFASLTVVLIVAWYSKSILQSRRFAIVNSTGLLFLYTFLLVLINLESYALITGTIGLLIVLVAIMSITKRIIVK